MLLESITIEFILGRAYTENVSGQERWRSFCLRVQESSFSGVNGSFYLRFL